MGRISFDPDKADYVINHVQSAVVPKYEASEGFIGFTLLVDRSKGEGIGISLWADEAAMKATAGLGDQAREGSAEAGSGDDQGSKQFEVAFDTRS
jgi:heme-degrading monooxygenase HmoA